MTNCRETFIIERNEATKAYSYVEEYLKPLDLFNLDILTNYRYTTMLFSGNSRIDLKGVWESLSSVEDCVSANKLNFAFMTLENVVLSRAVETDTHAAAQFVMDVGFFNFLLPKIDSLNLKRIFEDEIESVINE